MIRISWHLSRPNVVAHPILHTIQFVLHFLRIWSTSQESWENEPSPLLSSFKRPVKSSLASLVLSHRWVCSADQHSWTEEINRKFYSTSEIAFLTMSRRLGSLEILSWIIAMVFGIRKSTDLESNFEYKCNFNLIDIIRKKAVGRWIKNYKNYIDNWASQLFDSFLVR